MALLLYLDQNYLSGIVKRKPGFCELESALRAAVARGAVAVTESEAHRLESAARPDLPLLELLRELSAGRRLPNERDAAVRHCERRLEAILDRDFPQRRRRASDRLDIRALAARRRQADPLDLLGNRAEFVPPACGRVERPWTQLVARPGDVRRPSPTRPSRRCPGGNDSVTESGCDDVVRRSLT